MNERAMAGARENSAQVDFGASGDHAAEFADDEFPWREYLNSILANKWSVLSIAFISASIGVLLAYSAIPIYSASVSILVQPDAPAVLPFDRYTDTYLDFRFFETQKSIIQSRTVAELVVEKLRLDQINKFTGKREPEKPRGALSALFSALPAQWFNQAAQEEARKESSPPDKTSFAMGLQGGVSVSLIKDSQVLIISYDSPDPVMAADIANAVADAYIESGLEARLAMARKTATWLNERLSDLRQKLSTSENNLKEFKAREGVVDTESQQEVIRRKLGGLTERLVAAQAARLEAETRLRQMEEAVRSGENYDSLRQVMQHPMIVKLREDVAAMERRVAELDLRYGPKHPAMVRARSDLEETRGRLKEEIEKVASGVRKDFEVALANEESLRRLGESAKSEIRIAGSREFELAKLEREVETNRKLYETFLTRFKETDTASHSGYSNIRVIDRALPPSGPDKPNKGKIIKVFLLLGLLAGVVFALIKDAVNQIFREKNDVERALRIPALAEIPYMKSKDLLEYIRNRGLSPQPNDPFTESIKNIRTGLMLSSLDEPVKTMVITSASPGEGKTSLACNLGVSFAHMGRTLLMDLDLRKPRVAEVMGLDQSPGLTELLSGMVTLKSAVKRDEGNPNLDFITAGASAPNPLEIISSRKFSDTLAEIRGMYDYIIIDTPPVLLFSDALVVGQMGAILMVIKAGDTSFSSAREAVKRLRSVNLAPKGAILSHVSRSLGSREYFYGYSGYYDNRAPAPNA